jgi:RNA polymerase sigma-70 factor (ECF subfamily)
VELAQKRDLGALSALYEAYFDRIYRYMLVRVRNVTEAEDLAGQVFLKMVERIDSFKWPEAGGGFSAWLFRIAHNLIVDWSRGSNRTTQLLDQDLAGGRTPEETVARDESVREVLLAMNCLKDDQRQVVVLRLVGGLSSRETADVLGTTEGNVRVLQHRALSKIKEKLQVTADV